MVVLKYTSIYIYIYIYYNILEVVELEFDFTGYILERGSFILINNSTNMPVD